MSAVERNGNSQLWITVLVALAAVLLVLMALGAAFFGVYVWPSVRHELFLPATAQVGKPLPAGPDAYTEQDFCQAKLEWNRKTLAGAYQEVGDTDPAWDEPALELLEMFARYFSEVPGAPSSEELLAAAELLIDTECHDPLVLY